MITIEFPDKTIREFPSGSNSIDIAKNISEGLARNVLGAKINGVITDASQALIDESKIKLELLTWENDEGKSIMWHSSAHLMAEAIESFYPKVKFAIGPPIENGFYYDMEFPENSNFSSDDFPKIEKKIIELAREKNIYEISYVSKKEAIKYFKEKNNEYKLELIDNLNDGEITFYKQGGFIDLCKGPHIPNTNFIKSVKLLNVAGAYWKGNENNKQLTRIYGITFPKKKYLDEYLIKLEEAKQRDHRKIGKNMSLFTFSKKVGQGLPLWLPKGAYLRDQLVEFMKQAQLKFGYQPVITPHIGSKELYICSGHYEKYGEDSFQPIKTPDENEEFFLKPMNCPHHCEIYKSQPRSYKDLPIRFAEFGTVYRYEKSGELHGLTRVRGFTQDDAHIFATPNQVQDEFESVIDLVLYVLKAMGFNDYIVQISLRDPENQEKYIGSDENWNLAEQAIINSAKNKNLNTVIEYGEAAFYGPKLDFMIKDAIGRKWQLGTIQVDYNLPERFQLEYKGSDDKMHRPVMIHRAPFGSLERFIALLIEHTGGEFPLWLTPQQIIILPISQKYNEYSCKLLNSLKNYDIRGHVDDRNETTGKKIRDAELKKIPYMVVVGEQEVEEKLLSIREHGGKNLGKLTQEKLVKLIKENIAKELK
ncbi:MAG: threonine--tRNA ligase [Flavobacteriales bacterium]|nr:threonine--tRNA ligase [Flavobacteriales bacterium]|tara:strand:- start:1610 stop:3553 length:1944 start_codon:yes stop_codon:yes gene_type:complete